MRDSPLDRTVAIRDELFVQLQELDLFKATQALDDAVFALGGQRRLPRKGGITWAPGSGKTITASVLTRTTPVAYDNTAPASWEKLTQPDAAELALKQAGKPMPARDLLAVLSDKGLVLSASDPVASFGSQLSRNPDRFINRRIDGVHYWWLKALPWPAETDEAPDLPLEERSGASV